jgi:hypothetical protein
MRRSRVPCGLVGAALSIVRFTLSRDDVVRERDAHLSVANQVGLNDGAAHSLRDWSAAFLDPDCPSPPIGVTMLVTAQPDVWV